MSLEERIAALIAQYQQDAKRLELEGISARRILVRDVLHAESLRLRAFADELQDVLDASEVAA